MLPCNKRFTNRIAQSVLEIRSPHFYSRPSQARALQQRMSFVSPIMDQVNMLVNHKHLSIITAEKMQIPRKTRGFLQRSKSVDEHKLLRQQNCSEDEIQGVFREKNLIPIRHLHMRTTKQSRSYPNYKLNNSIHYQFMNWDLAIYPMHPSFI